MAGPARPTRLLPPESVAGRQHDMHTPRVPLPRRCHVIVAPPEPTLKSLMTASSIPGQPDPDDSPADFDRAVDPYAPLENPVVRREGRAQNQEMSVSLLRQGGIYEVESSSGATYVVDVLAESCSCPDDPPSGSCKHVRRVRTDIRAGLVPLPDGTIPEQTCRPTLSDGELYAIRSTEAALVKQQLLTALLEWELERGHFNQETQGLELLVDILQEVRIEQGYSSEVTSLTKLESESA